MKTYRWGIIGLGAIAHQFAETFSVENNLLMGAASRSLEKAEKFVQKFNMKKAYDSYEKMVQDPEIDIIYIATPHNHHLECILPALTHGKHVLCEKAITMNQNELKQAMTIAEEKHLVLAEAMTIFNMPLYQKLLSLKDQNRWGKLKMVQVSFGSYKEADPQNRFFNPELAGGALLDIGTYAVSFARFFLSEQPHKIQSLMIPFETGVDEQSVTILQNKKSELASISLTFQAKMPKRGIVAFEDAYIIIDDFPRADKARIEFRDGTKETIISGESSQALNYEISNMIEIIEKRLPNRSLYLTNEVMEILDKMKAYW